MNNQPIKENPSIKKLIEDSNNFITFKKAWPLLRPFFKKLGVKVADIDETLKKVDELAERSKKIVEIPDKFNDLFVDRGWIIYDWMNFEIAKKAIESGETGKIDEAENILLEFYSPEEISMELRTLIAVEAFQSRMVLAEKALIDFKEGRYYSTILVVLSLLDGMVNEIQQKGFFSKNVNLLAWDSVAAHSKGLQKLTRILNQTRKTTRTEQLTIPYRNGIMHGMDLGYDNRMVAVKSWVALFATRDWAIKAERNQLEEQPPEPKKSWKDLINQLRENEQDKLLLQKWKPREIILGEIVPRFGIPALFEINSPEQKIVEFLEFWRSKNYGFMAKCLSAHMGYEAKETPRQIREVYIDKKLISWELFEIQDIAPAITEIIIRVNYEQEDIMCSKVLKARLICETEKESSVIRGKPGTRWSLMGFRLREVEK